MPTKYVSVQQTPIHYWHSGATTLPGQAPSLERGEAVVFVHGAGWNGALWQSHMQQLAAQHSPLAFDFPGHGRSGGTEALASISAYRDCLGGFLDAVVRRPCVLVGHDLGAIAALAYACFNPGAVRGLVLLNAAMPCGFPVTLLETWHDVMRGRAAQPFTNAGFSPQADVNVLRGVLTEQVKTDPRVRYHDLQLCSGAALPPGVGALQVPSLLIAGRDDPYVTPTDVEALQASIPHSRLCVIDAAGHFAPWEQSAAFLAELGDFLQRLPGKIT
jgi:pimeloyl-ACP methyl ester carboxylesterase